MIALPVKRPALGMVAAAVFGLLLVWPGAGVGAGAGGARALVVLDFGIVDTTQGMASYRPHDEADAERLKMAAEVVREALAEHEEYRLVDHSLLEAAVEDATEGRQHLHRCAACQLAVAEALGAEAILAGRVHKVSNLILVMSLELREVESGETIARGQVSMRGNLDESWRRAARSLLRHHLDLIGG